MLKQIATSLKLYGISVSVSLEVLGRLRNCRFYRSDPITITSKKKIRNDSLLNPELFNCSIYARGMLLIMDFKFSRTHVSNTVSNTV